MRKAIPAATAAALIPDGASVMFGGFMGVGTPERLMDALVARGARGLTIIGNDTARPGLGIGKLIDAGCVARAIVSHIGTNPVTQRLLMAGEIVVELVPQGTLAERIRAGGCGLGGILTPTGVGTVVQDGRQVIEVDGRSFLLERPLRADFALILAHEADYNRKLTCRHPAADGEPPRQPGGHGSGRAGADRRRSVAARTRPRRDHRPDRRRDRGPSHHPRGCSQNAYRP